ncbi:ATP-dependent dethiobiotin synthetase BioD [uncultured Alphaproteobacteria bacterium]|uniref:ATP-dependent dethiobiotin synthetase BioD n=1 Tax=uncultured Alphaproteobacteria bacterium TaxID=91750 RepID=A0A212JX33_9PROT|nr:ATP-dependent dethiobiotin synthetase BioD [uncultured Alphaproteobacteria bacterium]
MKGFVVTGTDTDVGKTHVTAALCLWLQSRGVAVAPMKPVQTGSRPLPDGSFAAPDLDFSLDRLDLAPDAEERALMQPFCYGPACSPHLAVGPGEAGPTVDGILAAAHRLGERFPAVAVEGAGGLMVPLNTRETMLDLFAALGLPVVLVARVGLGTINHALLSAMALKTRGVAVAGVVLNETRPQSPEDAFIRADNPATISWFGQVPVFGTLPFLAETSAAALRDAANRLEGLDRAFAHLLP